MSVRALLGLTLPFTLLLGCGDSLKPGEPIPGSDGGGSTSDGGTRDGGTTRSDMAGADLAGIVDTVPPMITIDGPKAGDYVGKVMKIAATVTDDSGIKKVVVVVGGNNSDAVELHATAAAANTYTGTYDLGKLGKNYVLVQMSIRADDNLGNHSELAEEVVLDTTPPWMSMDGKIQMRASQLNGNQQRECSQLFSPLGDNAIGDGDVVQQIFTPRVRIEDHGNLAPGLDVERYSGVDPDSVMLYVIPNTDSGVVLAVDTDDDGICDDFNPTLMPTTQVTMSGEALALPMVPVSGSPTTWDYTLDNAAPPAGCQVLGEAPFKLPPALCRGADLTAVLPYPDAKSPIYSIRSDNAADCVGLQLDSLNKLPEGPTCAAVRATDNIGNNMVAFPVRFCIDRGSHNCPTAPSDCTGKWDKTTQMVVPGSHCSPATAASAGNPRPNPGRFPVAGEVRFVADPGGGLNYP